jgi:hypothetical protein
MSALRPVLKLGSSQIAVDVPHLLLATGIAGWCAWLCWDAYHSSADVENLILIAPISAAAVILYVFILLSCFHRTSAVDMDPTPRKPLVPGTALKVAGSMALLAAFVLAGPLVGFDIASFVYILAMMAFLGERRILMLLLVPLLFCVTAIYCFNNLLATPLPLFFVRNS